MFWEFLECGKEPSKGGFLQFWIFWVGLGWLMECFYVKDKFGEVLILLFILLGYYDGWGLDVDLSPNWLCFPTLLVVWFFQRKSFWVKLQSC